MFDSCGNAETLYMDPKQKKEARIAEIGQVMNTPDFWADKNRAQSAIKEPQELKAEALGGSKYDSGDAVMAISSRALFE